MAPQIHDATEQGTTPILSLPNDLSIRRYRTTDAAAIAHHANNQAIWLNMTDSFPHPYTVQSAHDWIAMQIDPKQRWHSTSPPWSDAETRNATKIPCNYVIALKDEVIGTVGLVFGSDVEARTLELGYWLGEEHWGKGIVTVAVKAFLDWTFETFSYIVRVNVKIFHWNKGSIRVAEKCGFKRECVLKAAYWKNGKLGDLVHYGKLRDGLEY